MQIRMSSRQKASSDEIQHWDLRSFLSALRKVEPASVLRISPEVDADRELAAVTKIAERRGSPVLMFERVRSTDLRVISNLCGTRSRIALGIGVAEGQAQEKYLRSLERGISAVDCRMAEDREDLEGEDVDLRVLPQIIHADRDAGPYITAGVGLTAERDGAPVNAGIYRMMFRDRGSLTVYPAPGHHLRELVARAAEVGEDLAFAVVVGHHPAFLVASQARNSLGIDSYEVAGSLGDSALCVREGMVVPFRVPAHAEVVLEGTVSPVETEMDGPFGEFSYYYGSANTHVFKVNAMSWRRHGLFHDIHGPHSEHRLLAAFPVKEAEIARRLLATTGIVGRVRMPVSGAGMHAYISLTESGPGDARRIILAALASDTTLKHVIVVDDDIDLDDDGHVLWAVATRSQADRDVIVIPRSPGYIGDPTAYDVADRARSGRFVTNMGIDATVPKEVRNARSDLIGPEVEARAKQLLASGIIDDTNV